MSRSIVINARAAVRPELGGVERWAREMTTRLPQLRPDRYRVLAPPPALSHRAGHAWEQAALPVLARGRPLLCPANLAPLAHRRTTVVIHDAAALRNPDWYSTTYAAFQAQVLPRIARRAEHVVTVSEFSKQELVELLHVPAAKITVIAGGVGPAFTPGADSAAARTALGRHRPYVLTVASATARKNLAALVPAAHALARRGIDLVVAGGDRPQFANETDLAPLIQLGHVDDALLPGLYAGAEAVAIPSLHEGFGLTALEAMASGTPVVAARAGALPETCGDAALLVAPEPDALADGLDRVLATPDVFRRRGLAHARRYTWDATARAVDALLTRAAAA